MLVKAFRLEAKQGKVFADNDNHWVKDSISTAAAYGDILHLQVVSVVFVKGMPGRRVF